jgi:ribonucleoside-diphosphate reductase alpha chain
MHQKSLSKLAYSFPAQISEDIWNLKYRFRDRDTVSPDGVLVPGTIHDTTVEDTWRRVARSLSALEENPQLWEKNFYYALKDFKYIPAGRIVAGAGTGRVVTLFNCFVMGTIQDSLPGIFDMLKEAALTMQQGGGIGYDFSTIRPKGATVKGVGSDASGPLSFMDVWDAMCKTIMSAGSRRGAMMATMHCTHPDIEDFITAKRDSARLRNFNLSVLISDDFMDAVETNGDWDLIWKGEVFKTIKARDLWNKIMQSTYDFAEPGVIFIDRINERNPLRYLEKICATNPCGEQPLPPYGACLLGSINLARLIINAFENNAMIDEAELERLVAYAVRMMDNVIDVSNFPLQQQKQEAINKRRIGLGVTGLADALLMLGITYGSDEAVAQTEAWMKKIQHAAYRASVNLAKERGAFPLFDREKYLESPTVQDLDEDLKAEISDYGIRNALLTSIAPTGTISLWAGNVSSGIEPVFHYSYIRKVTNKDGSKSEQLVVDYAVKLYREKFGLDDDAELPDYFVSAMTLDPQSHVRMQAAAQKWVDSSISKTINCPEDIPFEDFKDVYMQAWKSGCKGCTTYRPNDITGSVLSVEKPEEAVEAEAVEVEAEKVNSSEPMPRPEKLVGATYKLKWPGAAHPFYVTVNDSVDDMGNHRPFEVFVNTQNIDAQAWITALTRMISAVFRRGGDVSFVAKELKDVFDPTGGNFIPGKRFVPSLIALIGHTIFDHMVETGYIPASAAPEKVAPAQVAKVEKVETHEDVDANDGGYLNTPCPECGEYKMRPMGGCPTCECGYSKCG